MKVSALLIAASAFFAAEGIVVASPMSVAAAEDNEYADVTSFPARITRSVERHEIELEEAIDPSELSVWFRQSRTCGSFQVHGVEYADENGEWIGTTSNRYRNVAHFRTSAATTKLAVMVSTDVMFGLRCEIVVRKANFVVPDIVDILARYSAVCADDVCAHQIVRLDSNVQDVLTIKEADAVRFGLQSDAIYKLNGYVDPESTDNVFVVQSAQKIMN
jgi:hypothetical protein